MKNYSCDDSHLEVEFVVIITIKELLDFCSTERSRKQISHGMNLKTALLREYLEFLLMLGLLETAKNPCSTYYKTTTKGNAFLDRMKHLEGVYNS